MTTREALFWIDAFVEQRASLHCYPLLFSDSDLCLLSMILRLWCQPLDFENLLFVRN